jgi:hypothetical protein
MTFCLGAQSLRAPPLIAHRLASPGSVLALSPACRKADAGFKFSHLMRQLVAPTGSPRRVCVPSTRGSVPGVRTETWSSSRGPGPTSHACGLWRGLAVVTRTSIKI